MATRLTTGVCRISRNANRRSRNSESKGFIQTSRQYTNIFVDVNG
jgi:hypothetical protein